MDTIDRSAKMSSITRQIRIFICLGGVLFFLGIFTFLSNNHKSPSQSHHVNTSPEARDDYDKVVVITIDTWRADHSSLLGYPRVTTPFVDSLARKGIFFSRAYSAASHTAPSHASLFTSMLPIAHGLRVNGQSLRAGSTELLSKFQDKGFSLHAFPSVRFLDGRVGFPKLEGEFALQKFLNNDSKTYLSALENTDRTIDFLDSVKDSKKMIWVHYFDVHEWHSCRDLEPRYFEFDQKFSSEHEFIRHLTKINGVSKRFFSNWKAMLKSIACYDARLRYVDSQIERLYHYFSKRYPSQNTLWVILSDHGEGLGSHNHRGHSRYLYEEQIHVPLVLFSTKKGFSVPRVDKMVRLIDVLPTLLDLMNGGSSLVPTGRKGGSFYPYILNYSGPDLIPYSIAIRQPRFLNGPSFNWEAGEVFSLNKGQAKYIYNTVSSGERYDLKRDPLEHRNLGLEKVELLRPEFLEVSSLIQELDRKKGNGSSISEDLLPSLKALGYF